MEHRGTRDIQEKGLPDMPATLLQGESNTERDDVPGVPGAMENNRRRKLRIAIIASTGKNVYAPFLLEKLKEKFEQLKDVELVVVEGSPEATIVDKWALENNIKVIKVPKPNWKLYGNGAGTVRNIMIKRVSDYGIFFWINRTTDIKDLMQQFDESRKKYQVYKSRV